MPNGIILRTSQVWCSKGGRYRVLSVEGPLVAVEWEDGGVEIYCTHEVGGDAGDTLELCVVWQGKRLPVVEQKVRPLAIPARYDVSLDAIINLTKAGRGPSLSP